MKNFLGTLIRPGGQAPRVVSFGANRAAGLATLCSCLLGFSAAAQIPNKQLQFDFPEPSGITTTDSVHQIVLNLLSSAPSGAPKDLHATAGSGPAGNDNCLTWGSAGSGGFGGPIALTTGNTNINFGIVTNFTISMWVNPLSMQGGINPRIFVLGANATAVDPSSANTFGWQGNQNGGYNAAYNAVSTANKVPSLLSAGNWSFVTWTYTNGLWTLYGGGVNTPVSSLYSEADAFTPANVGSTFALALGNRISSTSRTFAGELAHVGFYLGAARPDYIEYLRESIWPLGSLPWITAPAGTNLDFSTTGLQLTSGQNLTGGGVVTGSVTNSAGSVILPGYGSSIGTLTFSNNLTLVDGGQLGFYLGAASSDAIVVKGRLTASGVTAIAISNIPPTGTYTLLTANTTTGSAANFQVVSNANLSGKVVSLAYTANRLVLTVAGTRPAASLTWVGDTANGAANSWDVITSSNWWNSNHLDTYHDGDTAYFTDAGTNFSGAINEPTLDVAVNPAAVFFNTTNAYTLTGYGSIAGSTSLTKSGNGSLALQTANTYSGGTLVDGGVLSIGNETSLGSPTGPLLTVTNGASFDLSGRAIFNSTANPVVISGPGVAGNQGALFSSVGRVTLPGYYGPVCIRTLRLAGDAAIGNDTYDWQLGPDVNSGNGIGGYLDGLGHSLTKVGDDTVVLETRNISPLSQLVIGNGGIIYANTGGSSIGSTAAILITNNAWLNSWDNFAPTRGITVSNNITIANGGGQLWNTLGAQGSGTANTDYYYGNVVLNDLLTILDTSFFNSVYGKMTFNGAISGTGAVVVAGSPYNNLPNGFEGANYVLFNGANTYSGPTLVSNLVQLLITTANQSGGAYTVVDNGTLDVAITNGLSTLPVASLTLDQQTTGGGNLSFSRISFPSATKPVIFATNLVINVGTLIPPATNYQVGQFPLIKYSGTIGGSGGFAGLTFDSADLPANVTASLVNNTANQSIDLLVTSAPATLPATGTNLTFSITGKQLTLSWPASYQGWLLQSNSASLNQPGAWSTVPGSDASTQQVITIDPTKAAVFYRMVHP